MAATIVQPSFGLQAPTNDDTMEISSDFGNMDGDIDIDLDSAGEQMQYEDDDQMIDDVKSDADNHHHDDVMVDGDTASNPGDREMQDDSIVPPPQEHDEELLDFSDDEDIYADDPPAPLPVVQPVEPLLESSAPTLQTHVSEPVQELARESVQKHVPDLAQEAIEQVQSETAAELVAEGVDVVDNTSQDHQVDQQPQVTIAPDDQEHQSLDHEEDEEVVPAISTSEPAVPESKESAQAEPDESLSQPIPQPDVTETIEPVLGHVDKASQEQPNVQSEDPSCSNSVDAQGVANAEQDVSNTSNKAAALTIDTEAANTDETEHASGRERQSNSPTITGLHPTVVEYDSNEIYLFPSSDPEASEQYLLENENLVTSSLGDLLQACRSVLGQSLSDDEELVLGVEELDLYVSEDSTPAFSVSFSELLDVFLQLHLHDGNTHPPPFRVTLTTKTRFTNRLNLITQAIAEGKGFSELDFLQTYDFQAAGFPEDEDFEDESYHEATDGPVYDEEGQKEQQRHLTEPDQDRIESGDNEEAQEHQTKGEQATEEQHDDYDHAEDYVSEYATEQHQEHTESAAQPEAPVTVEKTQDEIQDETQDQTQYHEADENESYVEDCGQEQFDDPEVTVASGSAPELYGEDDLADFYRDEDAESLTTDTAAAEDELDAHQPTELSEDDKIAAPEEDYLNEIPAPPEDESFDEENFLEEEEEDASNDKGAEAKDALDLNVDPEADDQVGEGTADITEATFVQETDATDPSDVAEPAAPQDDENNADESFEEGPVDLHIEVDGSAVDQSNSANAELAAAKNGVITADDPDEIDFDDDEEFNEEQIPAQATVTEDATRLSPSTKRSFSEHNEAEEGQDEQLLKKVRSS